MGAAPDENQTLTMVAQDLAVEEDRRLPPQSRHVRVSVHWVSVHGAFNLKFLLFFVYTL
jgi:hypothetical protein